MADEIGTYLRKITTNLDMAVKEMEESRGLGVLSLMGLVFVIRAQNEIIKYLLSENKKHHGR